MKSIVLGIMISAVSISFAQTDGAAPEFKERLKSKQQMKVQPAAMAIEKNMIVYSRKSSKSSPVIGVINVVNGTPFIQLKGSTSDRQMMPVNFPKKMAVNGQEIQFTYTVSDLPFPQNGTCSMAINVFDISVIK